MGDGLKMIYLAAPIHKQEDAEANARLIALLREKGYLVWAPQEAGIATEVARNTGRDLNEVRREFMQEDLSAMQSSSICVAFLGREREPSQGMLWEMGWFVAKGIPVIFYNPCRNKITLMAEFTVDAVVHTDAELFEALEC